MGIRSSRVMLLQLNNLKYKRYSVMFYNYNPVKLIHGEGAFQRAIPEVPAGSRIAVLYGSALDRHSVEDMATLATWVSSGAVLIRMDSFEPTESSIDGLVAQVPQEITFIVGIGGGSVMDSTKALAVCFGNKLKAAELKTTGPMSWQNTTRFGLVSTRPGSGSELNNAFVLMDQGSNYKRSYFSLYSYPFFAIQDSFFYKSLAPIDFARGLADAVSHVIDQYLADRDPQVVQDLMSIGYLKIAKELSRKALLPTPEDFLQLAWFSALVSSGVLSRGVKTSWVLHEVAHSLASVTGLSHALSITTVSRDVFLMARHPKGRLKCVADALLGLDDPSQQMLPDGERAAKFFSDLGLPVGLGSLSKPEFQAWCEAMGDLCPNLTSEEVSSLCKLP